jgi:hypothetical protein
MNNDPLLVGVNSVFPNQNSSTAPTVWEEDMVQAAQQGIPCGSGPMLRLTKRSTDQQFLPGGGLNPCAEANPQGLIVENLRVNPAGVQRLSTSLIAAGLVGGSFIGGIPTAAGVGVAGVGSPGDGVRGVAGGRRPAGHGVAGVTFRRTSMTRVRAGRRTREASACWGRACQAVGLACTGRAVARPSAGRAAPSVSSAQERPQP